MTHAALWRAVRLPANPIIRPHMDARMGGNVQGPSVIRVPEWVPGRLARFHLYFADHKGSYIRLALADRPEGPWRMHTPGALDLAESPYPTEPPAAPPNAGFGDRLPVQAPPGTPGIPSAAEDAVTPHIASPDVHVDHANRRIVMYLHGLVEWRTQRTRVALSEDGLHFTARPEVLGPAYFRVFQHDGFTYALAMPGIMFRSADGLSGFERGPTLFPPTQRHTALLHRGDALDVFWTNVGDAPERIMVSRVHLRGDWREWRAEDASEVLRPEVSWEGADLPVAPSFRGAINHPVNQLRDPGILQDEGRVFLYYAVAGEGGIAVAELHQA